MKNRNTISSKYHTLKINWGLDVSFEQEIDQTLDLGDTVIVMTNPSKGPGTIKNLYGVVDDKIVWRVQDTRAFNPAFTPLDHYIGIAIYERDAALFVATNDDGYRILIDPKTGSVVGQAGWVR